MSDSRIDGTMPAAPTAGNLAIAARATGMLELGKVSRRKRLPGAREYRHDREMQSLAGTARFGVYWDLQAQSIQPQVANEKSVSSIRGAA